MIKLKIVKVENYNYTFECNSKLYNSNIEFYNLDFLPTENDIIYIEENLLKEINKSVANFEHLDNINDNIIQEEIIVIVHDDKKYYLRRVYG